jgi:hypothetical protein
LAERSAKEQALDIERSRVAAETSAAAAQATLQHSISAFQQEQRPWLDVSNPHVQEGGLFHADVVNHGRTPAYDIRASCRVFELRATGIVEVAHFANQENGNMSVGATKSIDAFVPGLQRDVAPVGNEIACDVFYDDGFGNRNRLSYCYADLGGPVKQLFVDCNRRSYISK